MEFAFTGDLVAFFCQRFSLDGGLREFSLGMFSSPRGGVGGGDLCLAGFRCTAVEAEQSKNHWGNVGRLFSVVYYLFIRGVMTRKHGRVWNAA